MKNKQKIIKHKGELGILFGIGMFIAIICQAISLNFHWSMVFVFVFIYLPLDLYTIDKIIKFLWV